MPGPGEVTVALGCPTISIPNTFRLYLLGLLSWIGHVCWKSSA